MIAAGRAGVHGGGPAVLATGDANTAGRPVVIAPSLNSAAGLGPRVTTRVRTGIRRTGPSIITMDRTTYVAPTVFAARQIDTPNDGPAVIATQPSAFNAKPFVISRGRRIGD